MGSINKSHNEADGGILLFSGELILLYCDSVSCEIGGKESFKGRVYLTTHRLVVIINPYRPNSPVRSFCAPFCAISKCSVEQPIFGANYIEATVRDEADGSKSFTFKLKFSKGGAIELAMAMNRAVATVGRNINSAAPMPPPPTYNPSPSADYYQAPPTVYAPGYNCGVQMPVQQFPDAPPIGFIYASSAPPPYPGLGGNTPQAPPAYSQQSGGGGASGPTGGAGGYPPASGAAGYPPTSGAGGYPPTGGSGYPQQQHQPTGYPGYQQPAQAGGYPGAQQPPAGYPPQQQQQAAGYPGYQPAAPPQQPQQAQQQSADYPSAQSQAPGYNPQTVSTGYQPQQAPAQQPGAYPDLSNAGSSDGQHAWPSAPSFNPNWQQDDKKSS